MPNYLIMLIAYIVCYLLLLLVRREKRDICALVLVASLCVAFGLRDAGQMLEVQDPVIYAALISQDVGVNMEFSFAELGMDYLPMRIIHALTGGALSFFHAFLAIHLIYAPLIFFIYRFSRRTPGMFYILSGWMMFSNSGVLLLCNFTRQGYAILLFLCLLLAFAIGAAGRIKYAAALTLPIFHASSIFCLPGLFLIRRRRFYLLYGAVFAILVMLAYLSIQGSLGLPVEPPPDIPFASNISTATAQLLTKVAGAYILLLTGFFIRKAAGNANTVVAAIERTAIGFLLPTAAILLFTTPNTLVNGLRFMYWPHAVAFLYLATVLSSCKSDAPARLGALALSIFGFITWTNPNVSCLLVW